MDEDPLFAINQRLLTIEQDISRVKKRLQNIVEHRERKLGEKFRVHDRAVMLGNEFEDWRNRAKAVTIGVDLEADGSRKLEEELKTIVKSLVELVDVALGL